jgi:hypothetical protein
MSLDVWYTRITAKWKVYGEYNISGDNISGEINKGP